MNQELIKAAISARAAQQSAAKTLDPLRELVAKAREDLENSPRSKSKKESLKGLEAALDQARATAGISELLRKCYHAECLLARDIMAERLESIGTPAALLIASAIRAGLSDPESNGDGQAVSGSGVRLSLNINGGCDIISAKVGELLTVYPADRSRFSPRHHSVVGCTGTRLSADEMASLAAESVVAADVAKAFDTLAETYDKPADDEAREIISTAAAA